MPTDCAREDPEIHKHPHLTRESTNRRPALRKSRGGIRGFKGKVRFCFLLPPFAVYARCPFPRCSLLSRVASDPNSSRKRVKLKSITLLLSRARTRLLAFHSTP